MSIQYQYPQQFETAIAQNSIGVVSPAVSPTGTLVAQRTLNNLNQDQTAVLGTQLPIGSYLVIASIQVTGTPAATDVVPALVVQYSDGIGFTAIGPTAQGSITSGFTTSQSLSFSHDGLSAITAGVVGGQYSGNWSYSVVLSIYRQ